MDVAAGLAAHAAPLEDTPEWCRFSLPPQLCGDPIELEGTRLAFEAFFSGPNMFPSLRKDIDEDDPFLFTRARINTIMTLAGGEHVKDPAGQAVPVMFTFTPAGVLGAPPRPASRADAIKDASRRFSRANAVLFQQLQKFEARAAIVAACSIDLPGLSADMTSTSVPGQATKRKGYVGHEVESVHDGKILDDLWSEKFLLLPAQTSLLADIHRAFAFYVEGSTDAGTATKGADPRPALPDFRRWTESFREKDWRALNQALLSRTTRTIDKIEGPNTAKLVQLLAMRDEQLLTMVGDINYSNLARQQFWTDAFILPGPTKAVLDFNAGLSASDDPLAVDDQGVIYSAFTLHATELLGFSDISFQSIPFTGTSPLQLRRIIERYMDGLALSHAGVASAERIAIYLEFVTHLWDLFEASGHKPRTATCMILGYFVGPAMDLLTSALARQRARYKATTSSAPTYTSAASPTASESFPDILNMIPPLALSRLDPIVVARVTAAPIIGSWETIRRSNATVYKHLTNFGSSGEAPDLYWYRVLHTESMGMVNPVSLDTEHGQGRVKVPRHSFLVAHSDQTSSEEQVESHGTRFLTFTHLASIKMFANTLYHVPVPSHGIYAAEYEANRIDSMIAMLPGSANPRNSIPLPASLQQVYATDGSQVSPSGAFTKLALGYDESPPKKAKRGTPTGGATPPHSNNSCRTCGQTGHKQHNCPAAGKSNASAVNLTGFNPTSSHKDTSAGVKEEIKNGLTRSACAAIDRELHPLGLSTYVTVDMAAKIASGKHSWLTDTTEIKVAINIPSIADGGGTLPNKWCPHEGWSQAATKSLTICHADLMRVILGSNIVNAEASYAEVKGARTILGKKSRVVCAANIITQVIEEDEESSDEQSLTNCCAGAHCFHWTKLPKTGEVFPPWNRKVAMSSAFIARLRTAITGPMEAKLARASYPGLPQRLRFSTFARLPAAAAIGTSAAAQMPKALAASLG